MSLPISNKAANIIIIIVSILVPALVAILFYAVEVNANPNFDLYLLPKLHALINSGTTIALLLGLYFIKTGNQKAHQISMMSAVGLSVLFLLSYVTYHSMTEPTTYGGEGIMKSIYYFILITHIILAAVIVPLVLFTLLRAFNGEYARHRKLAKWTFPIWLYVSITGVVVYLMIAPYY